MSSPENLKSGMLLMLKESFMGAGPNRKKIIGKIKKENDPGSGIIPLWIVLPDTSAECDSSRLGKG